LIPYDAEHVPTYHRWLQDPHIQEMTATEPLDLEAELEYQEELARSTNSSLFLDDVFINQLSCLEFTKIIEDRGTGQLLGDINIFFQSDEDSAEINIMIAGTILCMLISVVTSVDSKYRKSGYASEALVLTMIYCKTMPGIEGFN
jgi:RimJ/RimL family protein N-acetyltransferase